MQKKKLNATKKMSMQLQKIYMSMKKNIKCKKKKKY